MSISVADLTMITEGKSSCDESYVDISVLKILVIVANDTTGEIAEVSAHAVRAEVTAAVAAIAVVAAGAAAVDPAAAGAAKKDITLLVPLN
jgi:hypothetical protein